MEFLVASPKRLQRASGTRPLFVYVLAIVCCIGVISCAPGTTPNIKEIFIGRCLDYSELSKRLYTQKVKNCNSLWNVFVSSWALKDPMKITEHDYRAFFDATKPIGVPTNKLLLWSGTYTISHQYSDAGARFISLEDSLMGYLVNGLSWCGMSCKNCDGINYKECPDYMKLPENARYAFWGGASKYFAMAATGEVRILVNGANPKSPAYRRDSYFSLFELPSFNKNVKPRIILVNDIDQKALEHCDTKSMLYLKEDLQARGFTYFCEENPPDIIHLMCVGRESNRQCAVKSDGQARNSSKLSFVLSGEKTYRINA